MASKVVSTLQSAAQPAGKAAAPSGTPSAITRTYGERIFTGIKGFDTLLGNGIPYGSAVLIEGGPGSGKTIFCLTMAVNHCMKGKRVLYMSFEEPEERLISHMESFGWNPRKLITDGLLRIKRFNALDVARSVEALLSEAKKELLIEVDPVFFPRDFKPDIVLIDSMTSISSAFSGEESRFRIYMEQLFRYLEKENISSFLIREVANPTHTGAAREEHV
ncbi:MAG: RAD55 family ATPase, partial [Candidatus Micrarchaeia archaeon]